VSVADDVPPEWVLRSLEAHERRTDREHAAIDTRITELARDTVPLGLYQRGERDRDEDVKAIADRVARLEERPAMTTARWMAVLGVVAAFLTVAVTAYGTMRGAK
jgi:hypothetical protein